MKQVVVEAVLQTKTVIMVQVVQAVVVTQVAEQELLILVAVAVAEGSLLTTALAAPASLSSQSSATGGNGDGGKDCRLPLGSRTPTNFSASSCGPVTESVYGACVMDALA